MRCEDCQLLLQGFLDKELSAQEQQSVNQHLIRCASCRAEHERMIETLKILDAVSFAEPGDEMLDDMWHSPVDQIERNGAFSLIALGYLGLFGYAIYALTQDTEGPVFPKIASFAVILGFVMLFVSILREQLRRGQNDRYKEIER